MYSRRLAAAAAGQAAALREALCRTGTGKRSDGKPLKLHGAHRLKMG